MIIYNNICEKCRNVGICSIWKTIKKFSEDHVRTPYPTDIEIKECKNLVPQEDDVVNEDED